jgi:uncharacterized protein YjdB
MKKIFWILGAIFLGMIAGCSFGGGSSDDGGGTDPVTLIEIQVEPQEQTILVGTTEQFTAIGIYSNSTMVDLTAQVTWSVTGAASISTSGLATGVSGGTAVITATYGALSTTSNLYVRATPLVSIDVYPLDQTIPVQFTRSFYAEGCDGEGYCYDLTDEVTWESSDPDIATIDAAGLAMGVAAGTTTITATFDLLSGSTTLTVTDAVLESIAVEPSLAIIARYTTQQFVARGTFDDASVYDITENVSWTSANTAVATIGDAVPYKGLAAGIAGGTTTITATFGLVSGNATLTVKSITLTSIAITPDNLTTAIGWPVQFTATGTFSDSTTQDITTQVAWTSSAGNVARISNVYGSQGLATPLHTGTTTIRATFALNGVTGSTTLTVGSVALTGITVTCVPSPVNEGEKSYCTAVGNFGGGYTLDITNSVNTTWSSSNKNIVSVVNVPKKNKGIVTGINDGTVTITAKDRKGTVSGTAVLIVQGGV